MRASTRGTPLLGIGLWLVACGGQAQSDPPANRDVPASAFGSSASFAVFGGSLAPPGPDASAGATTGASGGAPSALVPCEPVPDAACPGLTVNLLASSSTSDVWAERLQVPDYGTRPEGYYPPSGNTDPASWDHSPLPAGACVFRIHGLTPNCLRSGTLWAGSCEPDLLGDERLSAPSFYETGVCMRHSAPGCPTADPWNAEGHWWYLQPDGENVDVVVCAPECASSIANNSPCLALSGPMP